MTVADPARGRRRLRARDRRRARPLRRRRSRRLMPKTVFPQRSTDRAPSASRRRCSTASTATTGCSARSAREAKHRFERADWHGQQRAQRERIEFYDLRVQEGVERLETEFKAGELPMDVWQQVKLHYIGLLANHHQPELAETFFNSVTTKILHRSYFHNDFIFVRPAVSTEYIENDEPAAMPTYRAYYPTRETLRETSAHRHQLPVARSSSRTSSATSTTCSRRCWPSSATTGCAPTSRSRCCRACSSATRAPTSSARSSTATARRRSRCRSCTTTASRLVIDTVLFGEDELLMLFSFARAYFMVDMEVPSRLRAVPALADAAQAALRALQRARPGEAGQDPVLPRLPPPPAPFERPLPHRARHQGHGDAGVRPAVLPLRVQGDQGLLPAAEGDHARA